MLRCAILMLCVLFPLRGSGQDQMARLAQEEAVIHANGAPAQRRVELLKGFMKYADSLNEKNGGAIRCFARLGTWEVDLDTVVPVAGDAWPESTDISFVIQLGPGGKISAVTEVPTSYSGDCYNFYTTYFDSTGKTVAFYRSSAFDVGCGIETLDSSIQRPAREISEYFFNPDDTLLEKTYHLEGIDRSPIKPSECAFLHRHKYMIYSNWKAYAKVNGLPPVP